MTTIKYVSFAFLLLLFCSDDSLSPSTDKKHLKGMIKVSAAQKSFLQGSNDTLANKMEELPLMENRFSRDFWMDSVEVTQRLFSSIMGYNPVPVAQAVENHPVYNRIPFHSQK